MNENIIKAAIFTPTSKGWGLPTLFWGLSGVGKSDIIEEIGRKWKMHVEVLSPSERGEGAFGVTPVPRQTASGGYVMSYPSPDWTEVFEDFDGRGIVFLDELTTAPPIIQAAMLGLIQAKRIGGAQLDPKVRILGAANPPDQAANGWDLAAPAANRVAHIPWDVPSEADWAAYELGGGGFDPDEERFDPAAEEARVLAGWTGARARAVGLFTAFHQRRKGLLHKQPDAGDPSASRAWPSHRSWSNAVLAWASAEIHKLTAEERSLMVEGFIGQGALTEFLKWVHTMDLPDPYDVLDGRVSWDHDPSRLDRSQAVMSSLTAVMIKSEAKDPKHEKRLLRLWQIFDQCPADDVTAISMKPLSRARLTTHPAAMPVLARLRPMMKAAGLL